VQPAAGTFEPVEPGSDYGKGDGVHMVILLI